MSAQRATARLDPRDAFVFDTRDLGRRAGSMREVVRVVAAPEHWKLPLVEVAPGELLHLDLRTESVMEGVLVSGTAAVDVVAQCARCLEPTRSRIVAEVQELFGYAPDPEDADAPVLDGDLLDLEAIVRDAVMLAFPLSPLCDDDCSGLCVQCGERLDDLPDDHFHPAFDPRWTALEALRHPTADDHDVDNVIEGHPTDRQETES